MSKAPSMSELISTLNSNGILNADYSGLVRLTGGQKTALGNLLKRGTHAEQAKQLLHGWGMLINKRNSNTSPRITLATEKQAKYLADLELKHGYIVGSFYEARIKEVLGMDRTEVSELINSFVLTPKRPPKAQPIESGASPLADDLEKLLQRFITKLRRGF